MAEQKREMQDILKNLEKGIQELFESSRYREYLRVMSRFHRYSFNNTMLIYMQRPDATLVAGFQKWKKQFERHVKKGEHGITIIAPTPYKKKIEEQKRDPETQDPILDIDGNIIMEEKEITIPMFRPVKVFDVSQTEGKPLPELASSLSGNVQNYEIFLEALKRSALVPIEFEPMAYNMDGYFSSEQQRIAIREGMSEVQTISATVHEIAHSKLHNPKMVQAEPSWKKDRNTEEVEAESVSYAVCQHFGIETDENSFGYIATWSKGKELDELKASLETISKTSCELISNIEQHYQEICQERGITEKQKPESSLDTYPLPDLSVSADSCKKFGYPGDDLLPLFKDCAQQLFEKGLTIYMLQMNQKPEMVFEKEDIGSHVGLFAIDRSEWEYSDIFHAKIMERSEHQLEREQAFLSHKEDCFALYQIKDEAEETIRFMNMEWMQTHGLPIAHSNYDLIYAAPLDIEGNEESVLENLYSRFNLEHPADYHAPSLSVSDIIAIKKDGEISCHYVDSIGFREIVGFLSDNEQKNQNNDCPGLSEKQAEEKSLLEKLKIPARDDFEKTAQSTEVGRMI